MKKLNIIIIINLLLISFSCSDYLDVVPDNVATIEYAFRNETVAEQYLFTCYSYLPDIGAVPTDPAILGSDEIWIHSQDEYSYGDDVGDYNTYNIKLGWQNVSDPLNNYWDGVNSAHNIFIGIRECNVFLENIDDVPDLEDDVKNRWVAEVKFLKAYYHFYLMRMYGPIPLIKENLPVSATTEEVQVYREPMDDCFDYVVSLLDEALPDLPLEIGNRVSELGRITQPIALAIRAKVLITEASPLFNGNSVYANFTDSRGVNLFNTNYDAEKWKIAMDACKNAINAALEANHSLYVFDDPTYSVSTETKYIMSVRNAYAERWNDEIIWGSTQNITRAMELYSYPALDEAQFANTGVQPIASAPIHIAEMFHSENGVPIDEDPDYDYAGRYLTEISTQEPYYVAENFVTAKLNQHREPRFYGSLAFDGAVWFGNGRWKDIGDGTSDETSWIVPAKQGEFAGKSSTIRYNCTGYFPKKCVNFETVRVDESAMTRISMTFPIIRLADLYLLYAEASNEYLGPNDDAYYYLDLVRERSGLEGVVESWQQHSIYPDKPTTKDGLREIIHKERMIELVFEGKRFWDLRRWNEAEELLNRNIYRWNVDGSTESEYYNVVLIESIEFSLKDYFWPLREYTLRVNPNLVQNPYW